MSLETAYQAIEDALNNPALFPSGGIILNFIGGEPFLEIEQIDTIVEHFKARTADLEHPWHNNWKAYITTNGVNYHDPRVQAFIQKNLPHLEIHYSHDGPQEKHDLQRVFADGRGSWKAVDKNLPLWHKDFPAYGSNTMISHLVIPYIFETCLYFWERGFQWATMGLIFDPGWEEGDDDLLEEQMVKVADYLLEEKRYERFFCTLFDRTMGFWLDPQLYDVNGCSVMNSRAVTPQGNWVMCSRFANYTLEHHPERSIGRIGGTLNRNIMRPYLLLNRTIQSTQECLDCEVNSGCNWCQGCNYDNAQTDTIFQRSTHICKMHKAQVRANNYFWNQYDRIFPPQARDERTRLLFAPDRKGLQYLYVILDSLVPSFCHFPNERKTHETMSLETLKKVVYYSLTNNLALNIPLGQEPLSEETLEILKPCRYILVQPASVRVSNPERKYPDATGVLDVWDPAEGDLAPEMKGPTLILRTSRTFLPNLPAWLERNSMNYERFSLTLTDVEAFTDEELNAYRDALAQIASWLPEREEKQPLQLAFMTDLLTLERPDHCEAGVKHLTIAPDGSFFVCPGFYFSERAPGSYLKPLTTIGEVLPTHETPIPNGELFRLDHAPLCQRCDAHHCRRCVWLNKQTTLEVNTPSHEQCVQSHLERNASRQFAELLGPGDDIRDIPEIDYLDPLDFFYKEIHAI